jgi:hypothetical protein
LRSEPPELVIPFEVNTRSLEPVFAKLCNEIWLRPDDLTPQNLSKRLTPIFLPLWMVDVCLNGGWDAEAGFDYQVKSSRDSFVMGQWHSQEQIEKRVRWEPRLGQMRRSYQNTTSAAASDFPRISGLAGGYNYKKALPYRPDLLGGAFLRIPDRLPKAAWPDAQLSLQQLASLECQKACDAQHIRSFQAQLEYQDQNWTQLLMPLYVTYYKDDEGQPQVLFINGQTGQNGGPRLASQSKGWQIAIIAGVAAALIFMVSLILLAVTALFPLAAPLGVLGTFLSIVIFVFAVYAAVYPWQWNREQLGVKIKSSTPPPAKL